MEQVDEYPEAERVEHQQQQAADSEGGCALVVQANLFNLLYLA